MRLLQFAKVGVLAAVGSLVFSANASAYICDLTGVNAVCGPGADYAPSGPPSSTTATFTDSYGVVHTVSSTTGTYNGWFNGPPGSPTQTEASGAGLFDQGAIFVQAGIQPTGTGVIDSFLRVQGSPTEQGYNTDARNYNNGGSYSAGGGKTQFDEKSDPNYTTVNAVRLNSLSKVTINGTQYREFWLDVNEPGNEGASLISLDQLEIFLSDSNMLDTYTAGTPTSLSTLTQKNNSGVISKQIYSLDTGFNNLGTDPTRTVEDPFVDNWIQLDYLTNGGGSGKGDMIFYLPEALITASGMAGPGQNPYVYLYSQFGCGTSGNDCNPTNKNSGKYTADYDSSAGFEEWWTHVAAGGGGGDNQNAVPEPASLVLLGTGLFVVGNRFRRTRKKAEKSLQ